MPINADQCRSMLDQCRSMPINTDQCWSIPINADQYRSMLINADQCRSMPINADQCRSMPDQFCLIYHWSALIGIERNWSALIGIDQHRDHCHDFDQHWALIRESYYMNCVTHKISLHQWYVSTTKILYILYSVHQPLMVKVNFMCKPGQGCMYMRYLLTTNYLFHNVFVGKLLAIKTITPSADVGCNWKPLTLEILILLQLCVHDWGKIGNTQRDITGQYWITKRVVQGRWSWRCHQIWQIILSNWSITRSW